MRTRPMLHEAEAKTYEAEATKFGLEANLNISATRSFADGNGWVEMMNKFNNYHSKLIVSFLYKFWYLIT